MRDSYKTGIIFDLDGTLWNTTEELFNAWNTVVAKHGLPPAPRDAIHRIFMGMKPHVIAETMFPDKPLGEAIGIFNECLAEADRNVAAYGGALYDGTVETLSLLQRDYFLALVSNCPQEYLTLFFDFHQLGRFFDDFEIYGRTHLRKDENIRLVIERNALESAVYIGDTEADLHSARTADVPFVWAAYGFGIDVPSAYRIESLAELPSLAAHLL